MKKDTNKLMEDSLNKLRNIDYVKRHKCIVDKNLTVYGTLTSTFFNEFIYHRAQLFLLNSTSKNEEQKIILELAKAVKDPEKLDNKFKDFSVLSLCYSQLKKFSNGVCKAYLNETDSLEEQWKKHKRIFNMEAFWRVRFFIWTSFNKEILLQNETGVNKIVNFLFAHNIFSIVETTKANDIFTPNSLLNLMNKIENAFDKYSHLRLKKKWFKLNDFCVLLNFWIMNVDELPNKYGVSKLADSIRKVILSMDDNPKTVQYKNGTYFEGAYISKEILKQIWNYVWVEKRISGASGFTAAVDSKGKAFFNAMHDDWIKFDKNAEESIREYFMSVGKSPEEITNNLVNMYKDTLINGAGFAGFDPEDKAVHSGIVDLYGYWGKSLNGIAQKDVIYKYMTKAINFVGYNIAHRLPDIMGDEMWNKYIGRLDTLKWMSEKYDTYRGILSDSIWNIYTILKNDLTDKSISIVLDESIRTCEVLIDMIYDAAVKSKMLTGSRKYTIDKLSDLMSKIQLERTLQSTLMIMWDFMYQRQYLDGFGIRQIMAHHDDDFVNTVEEYSWVLLCIALASIDYLYYLNKYKKPLFIKGRLNEWII